MIGTLINHWFPRDTGLWFVDFMQQALYHPQWGYYSTRQCPFGADFTTAPEMTSLFGKTLARAIAPSLKAWAEPVIIEFGAGSGHLCVDILQELAALACLPTKYFILEVSGQLQHAQRAYIQATLPALADRVVWLDRWLDTPVTGVIIANEVLDAMPVHRFQQTAEGLRESRVIQGATGALQEEWAPIPSAHARFIPSILANFPAGVFPYVSEVNSLLEGWIAGCARMLTQGVVLLCDYGFPAKEYYHPDRAQGTLMCHHQHRAHDNPFVAVGEQDITAHVDFTAVAEAAHLAGLEVAVFTSQAAFLLAHHVLDCLTAITDPVARLKANTVVHRLLSPSEMGDLFKVMCLTKNYNITYNPVSVRYDQRGRL